MGRTSFPAGRNDLDSYRFIFFLSPIDAVKTKSALLNHTPDPLGKRPGFPAVPVGRWVRTMVGFLFRGFVIKIPDIIRASNEAISTADASPEILHDDPIFPGISSLDGANGYTRGVFTVHAGHG